jgi:hypothetical protein
MLGSSLAARPVGALTNMSLRISSAALAAVIFAVLAGCSFGVAQYQLYSSAFDLQFDQGEQVLNRLAAAERTVVRRSLYPKSRIADFNPDDAPYYVDAGDPPITGSIRQSLAGLKAYNDALAALSNGETSDAIVNRVGTIIGNLNGALGSLGAATGLPTLAGGAALNETVSGAIVEVLPVFKTIAGFAARESFRRQLIETYPKMEELLRGLRDGTPVMFEVIKRSYVTTGSLEGIEGISVDKQALLEKDRQLLAGWVILMDKSLEAMKAAALAAMRGASTTDLATMAEASIELRVLAEQLQALQSR